MNAGLNFLWFILGGFINALVWFIAGGIMAVSVVGLPWARACLVIGKFNLFPFGKEVISRKDLTGKDDLGTNFIGMIGNVIWFSLFGWIIALTHIFSAILCAITIIGIPFAIQHLKLAGAALLPVGKTIQSKELVALAKKENASARLQAMRAH